MQEWFMADMAPGGCYTHTKRHNNPFDVKTISLSLLNKLILCYRIYDQCQPCTPAKSSRPYNTTFFETVRHTFVPLSHDILVIKPKASDSATATQPAASATTTESRNEFDEQENFLTDSQLRNVASEGSASTTDTDISETLPYNPPENESWFR